jgi:predicted N-acetyltransferase YhbS
MTERAWEISTYKEEDKAGVLALIRAEYGDVDLAQEAYFDWLAAARPPGVRQWLVREKATGRVITSGTAVAARASWRGKDVPAMLGFNIVVAPEYRRQGIHTALARQTGEDVKKAGYCFTLIFPNPKSMPQLVRAKNYHLVSEVPLLIRPLDIQSLTRANIRNPLLQWGINLGWEVASRTIWRAWSPPQGSATRDALAFRVAEDVVLDESYDRFWDQIKLKYDLSLVRDRAFLQWRFHDIPTREYHVLSARQDGVASNGAILGYLVLRQADVRGTMTGLIADFMVVPGKDGDQAGLALLHAALQRFKQAGVPLVGGLMLPHTQEYAIMQRAGFLRPPQQFAPQPFHLFIRSYCDEPPLGALTHPESWYVSIADHDAA